MPSKGTPGVRVRIPVDLQERVLRQIASRNAVSDLEPWTFSDFVRVSLERELAKMARSRRPRSSRRKLPSGAVHGAVTDARFGEG